MASLDFPAEISALRSTFASIEAVSDVDAIRRDATPGLQSGNDGGHILAAVLVRQPQAFR